MGFEALLMEGRIGRGLAGRTGVRTIGRICMTSRVVGWAVVGSTGVAGLLGGERVGVVDRVGAGVAGVMSAGSCWMSLLTCCWTSSLSRCWTSPLSSCWTSSLSHCWTSPLSSCWMSSLSLGSNC